MTVIPEGRVQSIRNRYDFEAAEFPAATRPAVSLRLHIQKWKAAHDPTSARVTAPFGASRRRSAAQVGRSQFHQLRGDHEIAESGHQKKQAHDFGSHHRRHEILDQRKTGPDGAYDNGTKIQYIQRAVVREGATRAIAAGIVPGHSKA